MLETTYKDKLRREDNRVTYIVGLRSPKGFVISADSQETINGRVSYIEKIATEDAGPWEVAIGGAGRGELVDGFVQHAIETIRQSSAKNVAELGKVLRESLLRFYQNDVRILPG